MIVIRDEKMRRFLKIAIPFFLIPLLVWLGASIFDAKKHLLVSFGVALLSLFFFLAGFERKSTGARRMVLSAVMIALCIIGRMIPFFKPVTALTIIAAMYLGGETGFFVGAFSAVLSNFYFGQGPWTPFQMLAWGLLGLMAAFLSPFLKKSRFMLLLFGVAAGAGYSMVMDVWTVIWYNGSLNWQLYASALLAALPHTLLYSVSNFVFLWLHNFTAIEDR